MLLCLCARHVLRQQQLRPNVRRRQHADRRLVHFHGPKPDDYTAHRAGRNASHAIFESFVAECDRADNASLARGEGRGCSQYLDDYREALTRVQAEHPHRQ